MNLLHPLRRQDLACRKPTYRTRIKRGIDHIPTRKLQSRQHSAFPTHPTTTQTHPAQPLNRRKPFLCLSLLHIPLKLAILLPPRHTPQIPPRPHRHVHRPTRTHIHSPRVKLLPLVHLRRHVRLRPTHSFAPPRLHLPRGAETLRVPEISNLHPTRSCEKDVLRLDVPVRNAHLVHVLHAADYLREKTVGFALGQLACAKNQGVQVPTGHVLHDLAVDAFGVLEQVEGRDEVGVVEGVGDAELGGDAFEVFFGGFVVAAGELFDGKELLGWWGRGSGEFVGDADGAEGAPAEDVA